jgi:hypothetical protein
VLLAVFQATGQIKSVGGLDLRHGYWTVVWLAGLALISFIGDYGGGLGIIALGWGFVVNAVWSVFIYWLALRTGMPRQRIEHMVDNTPHDEVESAMA